MSGGDVRYRAFVDHVRLAAGSQDEIAIDPVSGRPRALSAAQARVLAVCRGERTLDEHAQDASRALGPSAGPVRALVEGLAWKGLLVPVDEVRARVRSTAREREAAPPIRVVGVPTRGRPEAVARCVRALLAEAARRDRPVEIVVADSSEGDAAASTREALRRAADAVDRGAAGESAVRYAGRAERAAFVAALSAEAGVAPGIVLLALLGDPRIGSDAGANRNALLLDAVGEPLLMIDDDVRPRVVAPPGARAPSALSATASASRPDDDPPSIAFVSGDPNEQWFAEPGAPIAPEDAWRALDPRELHEGLLGADVGELAARGPVELRAAGAGFVRRLSKRGGRVVTTQLGCAGDHGMGGSFGLLLIGGPSRDRLLASEARFRDAFTQRRVVRCPSRVTVADSPFCMPMSMALDLRGLVPPFSPAGRDSDGLFGAMLRACVTDSFAGLLPWAVEHAPEPARTTSFDRERTLAGRADTNEYIRMALSLVFDPREIDPARNLEQAGLALALLGSRPRDADLFFREHTMRAMARRLTHMERTLADHQRRPAFWAVAVEAFGAALRGALASPSLHLPSELVDRHGLDASRALFHDYLERLGALVQAWPAIVDAARHLRARGVRLSTPVGPP